MTSFDLTDDHTDAVAKAVATADKASALSRGLFTYFLVLGLYIGVIVSSTSDVDLILRSPATLPILNVDVPLVFFFAVAPAIFVVFHFNLLLQLWLLRSKLLGLEAALPGPPETARTAYRAQLFPFHFSLLAAGADNAPHTKKMLVLIIAIAVFVGPMLLLLFTQAKFLADHHPWMTEYHRILVTLDFLMLAVFFHGILPQGLWEFPKGWKDFPRRRPKPLLPITFSLFVSLAVFWPAYVMFADPEVLARGELPVEPEGSSSTPDLNETSEERNFSANDIIHIIAAPSRWYYRSADEKDKSIHQLLAGLRRFDAAGARLLEGEAPTEILAVYFQQNIERIEGGKNPLTIQGLSGYLKPVSLSSRRLDGANLSNAELLFADIRHATLTDAILFQADLTRADLERANLTRANLQKSKLIDARLVSATLTEVQLADADLSGANLRRAGLTRANLTNADLTLANLSGAGLWDANLISVNLLNANLSDVVPTCANFAGAHFAPDLEKTKRLVLSRASFAGAPWDQPLKTSSCDELLSANELNTAIAQLQASPPSWFPPNWAPEQGLPPAVMSDALLLALPQIACAHEGAPAIGLNGTPLAIPVCGKGESETWYSQWECAQFASNNRDPWKDFSDGIKNDNDPFDATKERCAALADDTSQ